LSSVSSSIVNMPPKTAPTPLNRFFQVLFLVYFFALCFALFAKFDDAGLPFGLTDKDVHSLTFAILLVCAALAFPKRPLFILVAVTVAFGGVSELIQQQVGRDGDILDWVADTVGVLCAYAMLALGGFRREMRIISLGELVYTEVKIKKRIFRKTRNYETDERGDG